MDIRPENEYDRLLRLSNEYFEDKLSDINVCGGFSPRYECVCDLYQTQCHPPIQNVSLSFKKKKTNKLNFTYI